MEQIPPPFNPLDTGFPEYGKSRFPKRQPKGVCRGCRGPITEKYRKTWCSTACKKKFDPFHVKHAVKLRAGEKCEFCGKDCSRKALWEYRKNAPTEPPYHTLKLPYPCDWNLWKAHPAYLAYRMACKDRKANQPKPEYDHIIPHSEGGMFTVENVRLLCRACHLKRTKEWHATRKKKLGGNPLAV